MDYIDQIGKWYIYAKLIEMAFGLLLLPFGIYFGFKHWKKVFGNEKNTPQS
jgi:hypothetical protein